MSADRDESGYFSIRDKTAGELGLTTTRWSTEGETLIEDEPPSETPALWWSSSERVVFHEDGSGGYVVEDGVLVDALPGDAVRLVATTETARGHAAAIRRELVEQRDGLEDATGPSASPMRRALTWAIGMVDRIAGSSALGSSSLPDAPPVSVALERAADDLAARAGDWHGYAFADQINALLNEVRRRPTDGSSPMVGEDDSTDRSVEASIRRLREVAPRLRVRSSFIADLERILTEVEEQQLTAPATESGIAGHGGRRRTVDMRDPDGSEDSWSDTPDALVESAFGLICNVDGPAQGWTQSDEWVRAADRWCARYDRVGVAETSLHAEAAPEDDEAAAAVAAVRAALQRFEVPDEFLRGLASSGWRIVRVPGSAGPQVKGAEDGEHDCRAAVAEELRRLAREYDKARREKRELVLPSTGLRRRAAVLEGGEQR